MTSEKFNPIERALIAAASMPAPKSRQILKLICEAGMTTTKDVPQETEGQKHYAKREKIIRRMKSAADRVIDYAKHETMRNCEKHFRNTPQIKAGEAVGHPFRGNQWTTATGGELERHEILKDDERPEKVAMPDILDTKEKLSSGKHIVSVYHRVSEPMSIEEARQGKAPKKYFVGPTGTYEGRSVGEAIKQYHKSNQILKDNEHGGFSDKIYKVSGVHYREYGKNALMRLRPKADWAQKDAWL